MEWGCYKYDKMYQPGKNDIPADTLTRVNCGAAINIEKLADLYTCLYHPGIIRLTHLIRIWNLTYSKEELKKSICQVSHLCLIKVMILHNENIPSY